MARTTALQEAHFARLANEHAAVSRLEVGSSLALVARNRAGAIAAAELVDRDGNVLPPQQALERLAGWRRQMLREAELAMQTLVATLALAAADDAELNLTAIASSAGGGRQTLYNRLRDVEVAR